MDDAESIPQVAPAAVESVPSVTTAPGETVLVNEPTPAAKGYRITRHPDGMTHIQHAADLSEAFYGPDADAGAWLEENS